MRTTDIQSELQRLFGAQDSAQGGAIVVWHDPDGSFTETLDTLDLPGVEVIREEDGSRFALKCRLSQNLDGQRILLYRRCLRRLDGDWFADVEARSQSFPARVCSCASWARRIPRRCARRCRPTAPSLPRRPT